jgi:hypothetical protein
VLDELPADRYARRDLLQMTRDPSRPDPSSRGEWRRRLDRIAADLNVLLVMFAIGLATLDLTFLVTQRVIDRLPQVMRVVHIDGSAPQSSFASAQPEVR